MKTETLSSLEQIVARARQRLHNKIDNKCAGLHIVSDGTRSGTRIYVDGVRVDNITDLKIEINAEGPSVVTLISHSPRVDFTGNFGSLTCE